MVSFIHNGSKITTWTGHSFKTKKKHKIQSSIFKRTYFLMSSCRSLDEHKDTGVVCQLNKTATPMKKKKI